MNNLFIYPGSFDPPTYGHLHIVKKFVETYNQPLTIVCSENPDKNGGWFETEEIKAMWHTYNLPAGVSVISLNELTSNYCKSKYRFIMVRGIRDDRDAEYEKEVMLYNNKEYNVENFIYIYCDSSFSNISSSKVRTKAGLCDFHDLYLDVSPGVIRCLWNAFLDIEDIIMVVGKPGSGKSTICSILDEEDLRFKYINTDSYAKILKPKLRQYFQTDDLFQIAKTREQELISVISKSWLDLLFNELYEIAHTKSWQEYKYVLVEIAYGLQPRKDMFRFLGDHIINVWCADNYSRNTNRNTEHLKFFIDKIPGVNETKAICNNNKLQLVSIETTDQFTDQLIQTTKNRIIDWSPDSTIDIF